MIVINSSTRQFNIPGADLVFGVTGDSSSTVKEFSCPRYVGNNLDLTGCFIRMNYRNANGEIDSYLVPRVTVDGDNVVFGWKLSPKVTMYKGNISFVMCVVGPDTKVAWHTTLGRGQVLEGLEPDWEPIMEETADVVAQLITMVEAQTQAVEAEGSKQIKAVQTAAQTAQSDAVAQIEAKGVNTLASIPEDYTAVQNAVDALARTRGAAIVCSVEGSAITVNDASDLPMQGMKIFGRSTQDGTPTPDAPVEITSVVEPVVTVAGKNLLDADLMINEQFVKNADGTYTITKNGTGSFRFSKRAECNIPKGTYVLSVKTVSGTDDTVRVALTFVSGKEMSCAVTPSLLKTIVIDEGIVKFATYIPSDREDGVYNTFGGLMLEVGSEATAYEPYKPIQTVELTHTLPGIPVTSGGNYTDSDGQQWICDEVDLERGVYVQRVSEKTLYDYVDKYCVHSNNSAHSDTILRFDFGYAFGAKVQTLVLCNRLKYSYAHGDAGAAARATECVSSHSASDIISIFIDKSHLASEDIAGFKDYLLKNETVVQYVLATPIETTLSETEIAAYRALHSNYPNTTVLNDAGAHMVVKYAADTKLYIDNKIAALVGG